MVRHSGTMAIEKSLAEAQLDQVAASEQAAGRDCG